MRNIHMDAQNMTRLNDGVKRVAEKGGQAAIVLMDDSAFLVSVKNRTVITAIARDQLKAHVFTNIDSAVIV